MNAFFATNRKFSSGKFFYLNVRNSMPQFLLETFRVFGDTEDRELATRWSQILVKVFDSKTC